MSVVDAYNKVTHVLHIDDRSVYAAPDDYVIFDESRDNSDYESLLAAAVPVKYWKVNAQGRMEEMTPQEKLDRDAAIAAAQAAALEAERDEKASIFNDPENALRAFMLVVLDELNNRALKVNEILDAVDAATSLADLKARFASISDYPQRTGDQLRNAVRSKMGL